MQQIRHKCMKYEHNLFELLNSSVEMSVFTPDFFSDFGTDNEL